MLGKILIGVTVLDWIAFITICLPLMFCILHYTSTMCKQLNSTLYFHRCIWIFSKCIQIFGSQDGHIWYSIWRWTYLVSNRKTNTFWRWTYFDAQDYCSYMFHFLSRLLLSCDDNYYICIPNVKQIRSILHLCFLHVYLWRWLQIRLVINAWCLPLLWVHSIVDPKI